MGLVFHENTLTSTHNMGVVSDEVWADILAREKVRMSYKNYGTYPEACKVEIEDYPCGLRPRHLADKLRQQEILEAMTRYVEAGKKVPQEWILEFEDINNTLGE